MHYRYEGGDKDPELTIRRGGGGVEVANEMKALRPVKGEQDRSRARARPVEGKSKTSRGQE